MQRKGWLSLGLGLSALLVGVMGYLWFQRTTRPAAKPADNVALYGRHVTLAGASNVQDLGGIRTTDGRVLQAHRLLRADKFDHLTAADQKRLLKAYKLRAIVDFRSLKEVQKHPDVSLPGVTYRRDSVVTNNYGRRTTKQFYRGLVSDPVAIRGYRAFFDQLLKQRAGVTAFHCTYGKDRTGVAALLVLTALGVDKATIQANYLYSNQNLAQDPHVAFIGQFGHRGKAQQDLHHVQKVKRGNLQVVYRQINRKYGSMDRFLKVLGMTPQKQTQLRQMYLTTRDATA